MNFRKSTKNLNVNLTVRELVDVLKEKNLKIAVAESCTGGLIAKLITDIPGASGVFECAICAYSNTIKEELLSVSRRTLNSFSAVSKETAMEMAANVRKLAKADIGVSTTGYAGPKTPQSKEIVGLVYIGISDSTKTTYICLNMSGENPLDREHIRLKAAYNALTATLNMIKTGVVK